MVDVASTNSLPGERTFKKWRHTHLQKSQSHAISRCWMSNPKISKGKNTRHLIFGEILAKILMICFLTWKLFLKFSRWLLFINSLPPPHFLGEGPWNVSLHINSSHNPHVCHTSTCNPLNLVNGRSQGSSVADPAGSWGWEPSLETYIGIIESKITCAERSPAELPSYWYPLEVEQQKPLKIYLAPIGKANVFQPSFFRGELLNFGRVVFF